MNLEVGRVYRHYKGGKYVLLIKGIAESNKVPMVGYKDSYGVVYFRPQSEFEEKFTLTEDLPSFSGTDLHQNPDAQVWAKAFLERHYGEFDDILGWMANAIMCGYDCARGGPINGDHAQYLVDRATGKVGL